MIYVNRPCSNCGRVTRLSTRSTECLECRRRASQRKWRLANPEKVKAQRERQREYQRQYQAAYRQDPVNREDNRLYSKYWHKRKKAEAT